MSLKINNNNISRVKAGQFLPTLNIFILDLDDDIDYGNTEMVNLKIINTFTKEIIHKSQSKAMKGMANFCNILINIIGIYNLEFSTLDMVITKRIKIIPSDHLVIKSSIQKNILVQNVPSPFPVKVNLEDIYGNTINSNSKVSICLKTENPDIQLFGEIIHYKVSIKRVSQRNFFIIDGQISPKLTFKLGNTYIFNLKDIMNKGFIFRFSTSQDGVHNQGDIFKEGTNYFRQQLYITIMRNTPSDLFYFCQRNPNMGNSISVNKNNIKMTEYTFSGSKPIILKNLVIPVAGRINIFLFDSNFEAKSSSLLIDVWKRLVPDIDKYNYYDYTLDYLLQSSVYTEKIKEITDVSFQPRIEKLSPWESGLSQSNYLKYKKENPQELDSLPVNVDNSRGGTVNTGPIFNPGIRAPYPSSSDDTQVSILDNDSMGLSSETLINMNRENTIQTGPKAFVVNDVLSLKDILKQKKVDNQPTSDPLKSNVITVD